MSDKQCGKCGADVSASSGMVTAGDHVYCTGHFQCQICEDDLNGKTYYELDGQHLCVKDFEEARGFYCGKCDGLIKVVDGSAITAMDKKFHERCFVCANCEKEGSLGGGKSFYVKNGDPWCEECGTQ